MSTWAGLFPNGRRIFHEGDDPKGFVKEIKERSNFDPSTSSQWGKRIDTDTGDSFYSYSFHCPRRLIDAIYGNEDYPMGS